MYVSGHGDGTERFLKQFEGCLGLNKKRLYRYQARSGWVTEADHSRWIGIGLRTDETAGAEKKQSL